MVVVVFTPLLLVKPAVCSSCRFVAYKHLADMVKKGDISRKADAWLSAFWAGYQLWRQRRICFFEKLRSVFFGEHYRDMLLEINLRSFGEAVEENC